MPVAVCVYLSLGVQSKHFFSHCCQISNDDSLTYIYPDCTTHLRENSSWLNNFLKDAADATDSMPTVQEDQKSGLSSITDIKVQITEKILRIKLDSMGPLCSTKLVLC